MNWLDRSISAAFPGWALGRLRARAALEVLRSYDAAKRTRSSANWITGTGSSNSEIAPAIATVRSRSRDMARNNPYAARAINGLTSKSVGTGIMARWDAPAQKQWNKWIPQADFEGHFDLYGLQNHWARAGYESGEVLIRRIRTRDEFGIRVQTLESDYIDSSKFGPLDSGNYVIAGAEVDRLGRKVAMWLFDQHPGEMPYVPKNFKSKRVPMDDLIHFGEKKRPGELRYMPRLTASMMKLRDIDEGDEADLVRKKIQACFVAFVTGGDPQKSLGESSMVPASGSTPARRTEMLSPGMIYYPRDGENVTFGNPVAVADESFTKRQLHAVAIGCGMTYELLTGDLSDVNYSSFRAGLQDFREFVDEWRWIHFAPVVLTRVARWWEESAWDAGKLRTTGHELDWTPPKWSYVDPQKEIKADVEELDSSLISWPEKQRQRGYDPEVVLAEMEEWNEKLKKAGIRVTPPKAAPVSGNEPPPDEDDKKVKPKGNEPQGAPSTHH